MAFDPNFEKVVTSIRKNLGVNQVQVESRLPETDDVKKIICGNAKANISNVEVNGKDIVYSGFVNFQVVYLNANDEPVGVDFTVEFKDKYLANMELNNTIPVVAVSVVDVNTTINGEIRCVATLEIKVDVIVNNWVNALTGINGSSTIHTKKEVFNYSNYVATATDKFEIINDVEIKDGINKILAVCPSVYISKITPNDRFVSVDGGVYLDVCYLADNGAIRTQEFNYDFNQEISQEDIDELSLIQSDLSIIYNDIKITTSIDTDSAIVNVNLPINYRGYIFKNNQIDVVSDLFCTKHFTSVAVESVETINMFNSVIFDEKLTGSVTMGENDAFIDEVLGNCGGSVVVANSRVQDGTLFVEGVATACVMYLNKEANMVYSTQVEMPFSATTNISANDNSAVNTQVSITKLSSRSRRGKEIEVVANLEIYCDIYQNEDNAVITQVAEDDEIPENECAMSFYVTKDGDTIWEIAKEMRVSTELLIEQNPGLIEPISAGTKVVVYRQRQVEF